MIEHIDISFTMNLSPTLAEELRTASYRLRLSQGAIVRQALRNWLDNNNALIEGWTNKSIKQPS